MSEGGRPIFPRLVTHSLGRHAGPLCTLRLQGCSSYFMGDPVCYLKTRTKSPSPSASVTSYPSACHRVIRGTQEPPSKAWAAIAAADRKASWGNVGRATSTREIFVGGGVRLKKIRNLAEYASHGPGAQDGPTSLKFRSRLKRLEACWNSIMTTSTSAKNLRACPFEGIDGNIAPLTLTAMSYGGMLDCTSRPIRKPSSLRTKRASLPASHNGATPRPSSVRTPNGKPLQASGSSYFPSVGKLTATHMH